MKTSEVIKEKLTSGQLIDAPGVFDGLSARLVELAGFDAIYASGDAIARAAGFPDIGLLSLSEVVDPLSRTSSSRGTPSGRWELAERDGVAAALLLKQHRNRSLTNALKLFEPVIDLPSEVHYKQDMRSLRGHAHKSP